MFQAASLSKASWGQTLLFTGKCISPDLTAHAALEPQGGCKSSSRSRERPRGEAKLQGRARKR